MRIGIMLRSYDEYGGIGIYTRNLIKELLKIDRNNQYVLFYKNAASMGNFSHYSNVKERRVKLGHKLLWDQIAIPFACWREKVDIVLHPKFTVPLVAPCKAIMVVHGADWFIPEQAKYYKWWDVLYAKAAMPLYFRKSDVVISVSQITTDNFNQVLKLPPGKVKTVYFGPASHFKRVSDNRVLKKVKEKYNLPDKFILTLAKRRAGERKNIHNIIGAYSVYHRQTSTPYKLVIGGKDCIQFREEYGSLEKSYWSDILFPNWVDQEDLPAVYTLADLFLYPSNLEAFPIPITEALACGTPIVTSNANGMKEIAGDAALFVNPKDVNEIADTMFQVLADPDLRVLLSNKGLNRSENFSWTRCANEILNIIEHLAALKRVV